MVFRAAIRDYSKLAILTAQLSKLFAKGVPLNIALDSLAQTDDVFLAKIYQDLALRCRKGESLFSGLSYYLPKNLPIDSHAFSELPNLGGFLEEMTNFLNSEKLFMEQLGKSLLYPVVLLFFSLGFLLFFLFVLLPMYERFFTELNIPIPDLIANALVFSSFLLNYGLLMGVSIGIGFFMNSYLSQRFMRVLNLWWYKNQIKSDLCFSVGLLLKSGVPMSQIVRSLKLTGSSPMSKQLEVFKQRFFSTGNFSKYWYEALNYSHYIQLLINVSESQESLDSALLESAELLRIDHYKKCERISKIFPGVCLVVISLLISVMAYVVFVPVISSISNIL